MLEFMYSVEFMLTNTIKCFLRMSYCGV